MRSTLLAYTALVTGTLLMGCGTQGAREFRAPDGSNVKSVKCTSDPHKCYESAAQSCPDGGTYRVVSSESHAGGMLADLIPGPVTWYGMTYVCGPSDGRMPDFKFQGSTYVAPPVVMQPSPARVRPSTTTCNTYGGTVTCNTY